MSSLEFESSREPRNSCTKTDSFKVRECWASTLLTCSSVGVMGASLGVLGSAGRVTGCRMDSIP